MPVETTYQEVITNKIPFQVYSFDAIFQAIQPYLKKGFKFDFETNEGYPVQIGTVNSFHILEYRMEEVEQEPLVETETKPEVKVEEVPAAKPASRRAKNS